jgi:Zn-dependent protease with chaperone function
MTRYRGNLYQSNSADAEAVELELHGRDVLVRRAHGAEQGETVIPLDRAKLSAGGFDGKRIVIEDTAGGVTLIADDDGILKAIEERQLAPSLAENIQKVRKAIDSAPHTERQHWALLIGIIVVIGIAVYLSIDAIVGFTADHIPRSFETKVGDFVIADYRRKHTLESDGPQVRRLQNIVDRLTHDLPKGDEGYKFRVYFERTDDVNAFAVPGGNIVVFKGLLDQAKNDSEIAGVLGHEIGHVINRDTLHAALHSAGLLACLNILLQGHGGDAAAWLGGVINLDNLRYGRDQEATADKTGVDLAFNADYDPHGLMNLFKRIQEKGSWGAENRALEFLSDHPCTPARIEAINSEIANLENNAKHHAKIR